MRILVAGSTSYVGLSVAKWLRCWGEKYDIKFISLRDKEWKEKDFSGFDVLLYVAALVHKKERPELSDLYFTINRDLTIEVAHKAKRSGISHFIFMSSMSVYGVEGKLGKDVIINKNTQCHPNTYYGASKLEAELALAQLSDEEFGISIIRAPMIYGPGAPGNYQNLKRFVLRSPVFPFVNNKRSMLFIDNLTEFIRQIIENREFGVFCPQNKDYVSTVELVSLIAKEHNKKVYFSKFLSSILPLIAKRVKTLDKVFGNLVYDKALSNYNNFLYCLTDLESSIKITERQCSE